MSKRIFFLMKNHITNINNWFVKICTWLLFQPHFCLNFRIRVFMEIREIGHSGHCPSGNCPFGHFDFRKSEFGFPDSGNWAWTGTVFQNLEIAFEVSNNLISFIEMWWVQQKWCPYRLSARLPHLWSALFKSNTSTSSAFLSLILALEKVDLKNNRGSGFRLDIPKSIEIDGHLSIKNFLLPPFGTSFCTQMRQIWKTLADLDSASSKILKLM